MRALENPKRGFDRHIQSIGRNGPRIHVDERNLVVIGLGDGLFHTQVMHKLQIGDVVDELADIPASLPVCF
ncbi:hypothetical protein D3C87_1700860 [compost metagenome]